MGAATALTSTLLCDWLGWSGAPVLASVSSALESQATCVHRLGLVSILRTAGVSDAAIVHVQGKLAKVRPVTSRQNSAATVLWAGGPQGRFDATSCDSISQSPRLGSWCWLGVGTRARAGCVFVCAKLHRLG